LFVRIAAVGESTRAGDETKIQNPKDRVELRLGIVIEPRAMKIGQSARLVASSTCG